MALELRSLRNKSVFGFFIIDALLITLILSVQTHLAGSQSTALQWQCTDPVSGIATVVTFQPIAILFIVVFGGLQLLQFVCSLVHQCFNFLQIMSSVELLNGCKRYFHKLTQTSTDEPRNTSSNVNVDVQDAVNFARQMQKLSRLFAKPSANRQLDLDTAATGDDNVEGISYSCLNSAVMEEPVNGVNAPSTKSSLPAKAAAQTEVEPVATNNTHQPTLDRAFVTQLVAMENDDGTSVSAEYCQFESTVQTLRLAGTFRTDVVQRLRQEYNLNYSPSSYRLRRRTRNSCTPLSTLFEPPPDYDTVNFE